MSQLHPFLRGYRQALRDVQRAVLLYHQTVSGPGSTKSAIAAAADVISVPLKQLRQNGIEALDAEVREQMATVSTTHSDYVRGYQVGFDKATAMAAGCGRQMNDLAAREAIEAAVTHLREA